MAHIHWDDLERYLLNYSPAQVRARVHQHIENCPKCRKTSARVQEYILLVRKGLIECEGIVDLHQTDGGVVALQVQPSESRGWVARVSGAKLDAGRRAWSRQEALKSGLETFEQMLPEHRCTPGCRRF